jgi:hypothetical protein
MVALFSLFSTSLTLNVSEDFTLSVLCRRGPAVRERSQNSWHVFSRVYGLCR